jgi:hypothetical protein
VRDVEAVAQDAQNLAGIRSTVVLPTGERRSGLK